MFRLSAGSRVSIDLGLSTIADQFEVLLFDERPILYTGVNKFGTRILGSAVDEDEASGALRFFHVLTPPAAYGAFLRRSASYLDLIKQSDFLFILDRTPSGAESVFRVAPSQVPAAFLPRPKSYCPPIRPKVSSFQYVSTLNGLLSDKHRAEPEPLAALISHVPHVLHDPFVDLFGEKESRNAVTEQVQPFREGSFAVHFDVMLRQMNLFTRAGTEEGYIRQYLDYCLNSFQAEAEALAVGSITDAPHLRRLVEAKQEVLGTDKATSGIPPDESLVKSIERSAKRIGELAEVINGNISRITLSNVLPSLSQSVVGIIDSYSASVHEKALDQYQRVTQSLVDDAHQRKYTIEVYRFNNHSGKGAAALFTDAGIIPSVPIKYEGDDATAMSALTRSLHEHIRVSVKGIATKRGQDGLVTRLTVYKTL